MAKFRIAVLISGGSTTLRNLIRRRDTGELDVQICLVISSNPTARGLEFSRAAEIPAIVLDHREFRTAEAISHEIFSACREHEIDLVVCGGFLRRLKIPGDFANRVINIHPSLIPEFCGRGMYGLRVHRAVLDSGQTCSGCTVHVVDDQFDHGPVIARRKVPVAADDSPESLAERVFQAECELYPAVIQGIATGQIRIDSNPVRIPAELTEKQ